MELTAMEDKRFMARIGMFKRRGLMNDAAADLAYLCLTRDRDLCELRACIECKNLQERGFCSATKRLALPKEMFHRCPSFGWQVPRTQGQA